jgi:site-specific DNA-adenine methylase
MHKSYQGGKGSMGVHQKIINLMPKHRTYIETHLGSGTILRKKKPAHSSIAIEIDEKVLNDFKYSIDNGDDEISKSLKNQWFWQDDAVEYLKQIPYVSKDTVIYCDPPYVISTRKNQKPMYKHEYNDDDHRELISVLNSFDCFVMLSGYESELYNELLDSKKWYKFTFNAMTRQGVRTECLWCNFNPDDYIKHDYSFIGDNFRERERIKRKGERWIKNLEEMGADERNFILSKIQDRFNIL